MEMVEQKLHLRTQPTTSTLSQETPCLPSAGKVPLALLMP